MRFLSVVVSIGLSRFSSFLLGLSLIISIFAYSKTSLDQSDYFESKTRDVIVVPPSGKPEISQESIDVAMVMFGIKKPENVEYPVFDPNLLDRGMTLRVGWFDKAIIKIGSPAFLSWGLLGSTLAHEIEIHANQSFFAVNALDFFGFDGTGYAERAAYQHEIAFSHRFGLSVREMTLIADTEEYYFSDKNQVNSDSNLGLMGRFAKLLQK